MMAIENGVINAPRGALYIAFTFPIIMYKPDFCF